MDLSRIIFYEIFSLNEILTEDLRLVLNKNSDFFGWKYFMILYTWWCKFKKEKNKLSDFAINNFADLIYRALVG